MRLLEMNPLLPTYTAAIAQSTAEPNADSDDNDYMLGPHARRRRKKEQIQEDLIDFGGSYTDELRAISPIGGTGPLLGGVDSKMDVLDVLAPPAHTDTKVFLAEIEPGSVEVGFVPGTGSLHERPRNDFGPTSPGEKRLDEKQKNDPQFGSSVTRKLLPMFKHETGASQEPKSEQQPALNFEAGASQKQMAEQQPNIVLQYQEPNSDTQRVPQEPPKQMSFPIDAVEASSGSKTAWGPENRAMPGWETYAQELDSKPISKPLGPDSLAELDTLTSKSVARAFALQSAVPSSSVVSQGEGVAAHVDTFAMTTSTGFVMRKEHSRSASKASVASLYTVDPGPAPYASSTVLQSRSEPLIGPISPPDTTEAVEPVQTAPSRTDSDGPPKAMSGYLSRHRPLSRPYLVADPIPQFNAETVRTVFAPSASTSVPPRRPVRSQRYSAPSPMNASNPIISDLTQSMMLAQDSMKEVQVSPPDLPPQRISRHPANVPPRPGVTSPDSFKEVVPHAPPIPPKIKQRPVPEPIDSGFAAEDTMKVSVPRFRPQSDTRDSDTSNVLAVPGQHMMRQSQSFEQPQSMRGLDEQELKTAEARKEERRRRRAMMNLILGDDDDP
jgi:hypothetical protein